MTGLGGIGYNGMLYSSSSHGTVFQVTPDGAFTNLVLFTGGELPFGGLMQGADGNLYGTTRGGGAYGNGTIFRLSIPMPPVFQTVAQSNSTLWFTLSAAAGQAYQIQCKTNLIQTTWNSLGDPITATNGTITASDAIGPDPQRFYRVGVVP